MHRVGDCFLFDFRLRHRGLGNHGLHARPVVYLQYCVPSFKVWLTVYHVSQTSFSGHHEFFCSQILDAAFASPDAATVDLLPSAGDFLFSHHFTLSFLGVNPCNCSSIVSTIAGGTESSRMQSLACYLGTLAKRTRAVRTNAVTTVIIRCPTSVLY